MSQVFLTGATGYLGGQVLRELSRSHPELSICALVRDEAKAQAVRQAFPNVRTVLGDLDTVELLEREAAQASIVLHLAATGHLKSVQAIHQGLKKHESATPRKARLLSGTSDSTHQRQVYWIQISGASALAVEELASDTFVYGSSSSTVYDDLAGVSAIRDLIRAHPSRAVDNYVLDITTETPSIRTALVFPPIIYGEGEGPVNQRSIQLPSLAAATLEKGHGVQVGQGLSIWGDVHIRDVGRLFSLLVEAAEKHDDRDELWGDHGIYLTGVGDMNFGEISTQVARTAKELGLIQDETIEVLGRAAADTVLPHGSLLFGTNTRGIARRGKECLGWNPQEGALETDISRAVIEEDARRKKT